MSDATLRIYADISAALDSAMRIHCATKRITRKKLIEDLLTKEFAAVIAPSAKDQRPARLHQKKG